MANKPPKEVVNGIILLITAALINLIKSLLNPNLPKGIEAIGYTLSILIALSISFFFVYKIYKGKRWARTTALIIVSIIIFIEALTIFIWLPSLPILSITLTMLEKMFLIVALIFLYDDKSSKWFESRLKKKTHSQIKKRKSYIKKVVTFASIVIILILLYAFANVISPEEIINKIGVKNGYIIGFIVSLFGGFSAVGSVSMFTVLIALISSGLNWIILGLFAGIALSLGDMLMFFSGGKGREIITGKWDKEITSLATLIKKRKLERFIPAGVYIYLGFIPLPNDWLLLFLAAIKYPPKKMNLIIILGDISFGLVFTFLASRGIMLFT